MACNDRGEQTTLVVVFKGNALNLMRRETTPEKIKKLCCAIGEEGLVVCTDSGNPCLFPLHLYFGKVTSRFGKCHFHFLNKTQEAQLRDLASEL